METSLLNWLFFGMGFLIALFLPSDSAAGPLFLMVLLIGWVVWLVRHSVQNRRRMRRGSGL